MTLLDYYRDNLPEYYTTMYLDGYTPQQIIMSASNTLYKEYLERKDNQPYEVVIKQEVVKK